MARGDGLVTIAETELSRQTARIVSAFGRLGKEVESDVVAAAVRLHAFEFAYDLSTQTEPRALRGDRIQMGPRRILEEKIEADISRAYSLPGGVYSMLEEEALGLGGAFYRAAMAGDEREVRRILDKYGGRWKGTEVLRGEITGRRHQRLRNNRGSVRTRGQGVIVMDRRALAGYKAKIVRRAGIAKGGWLVGRERLLAGGAQVRISGGINAAVPGWLTDNRQSGGVVDRTRAGSVFKVVHLQNRTPYIGNLIGAYGINRAAGFRAGQLARDMKAGTFQKAARMGFRVGPV